MTQQDETAEARPPAGRVPRADASAGGLSSDPVADLDESRAPSLVLDLPGGPLGLAVTHEDGAEDEPLAQELRRLWSHLLMDDGHTVGSPAARADLETITVTASSPRPHDGIDAETARRQAIERDTYTVSGRVTRALLSRLVGSRILLHAGTVHREDIGTIVVIGPSGAGKSTATCHLAQDGQYLSDELTMLDTETFEITGYPKPVSRAGEHGYKRDLHLGELGLVPARTTSPPDHVVLLSRDASRTAPAQLTRAPLASALVRITEQSSSLWRLPRPLETLARLLDAVGGALDAAYAESNDLLALLSGVPGPQRQDWSVIDPRPEHTSHGPGGGESAERPGVFTMSDPPVPDRPEPSETKRSPLYATSAFRQGLLAEDGTVVLRDHRVIHLTGINALVWELLAEKGPLSRAGVVEELIEVIGDHPQAMEFTQQALDQLTNDDLIQRA